MIGYILVTHRHSHRLCFFAPTSRTNRTSAGIEDHSCILSYACRDLSCRHTFCLYHCTPILRSTPQQGWYDMSASTIKEQTMWMCRVCLCRLAEDQLRYFVYSEYNWVMVRCQPRGPRPARQHFFSCTVLGYNPVVVWCSEKCFNCLQSRWQSGHSYSL